MSLRSGRVLGCFASLALTEGAWRKKTARQAEDVRNTSVTRYSSQNPAFPAFRDLFTRFIACVFTA
jgi:hypothetical protein